MTFAKSSPQIEPLEARIAPATILLGARGTAGTTNYDTAAVDPKIPVFFNTTNAAGSVNTVDVGGDADTYYIKLNQGDTLRQFGGDNGGGFSDLLTVTRGTVVAFFVDGINKLQVDQGELSGLSLGPGASITLNKDLDGSILTNYDAQANKIVMNNLLGPKQTLASVTAGGSITGGIYAGGSISKISVTGGVSDIRTGAAANGVVFDLLRGAGTGLNNNGVGTLTIVPAAGEAGGSISNVEVRSVNNILAGSGGAGAKGGFITNVKILADTDTITIRAGAGGASVGGKAGGAGGDVSKIFVSGATDTTTEFVQILAGDGGGTAAVNAGGRGGVGGKASSIFVGFESVLGKPVASAGLLSNVVEVGAGKGGDALVGGKGGDLTDVKVLTQTRNLALNPFISGLYETSVRAGNGGVPNDASGGASGVGGLVRNVEVTNQNFDVGTGAGLLIAAGKGGQGLAPNLNAKGAVGGAITNVSVLGFNTDIFAGDGSSGSTGGKGGSLTTVSILSRDLILANIVNLSAGKGGDAANGVAGNGGDIRGVSMPSSNLRAFTVNTDNTIETVTATAPGTLTNTGDGGDGGKSTKGRGGRGGLVSGFDVIDGGNGTGPAFSGDFLVRSGKGGDGDRGGGIAGDITAVTLFSLDLGVKVQASAGGSATATGAGGAGGNVRSVNLTANGLLQGVQVNGLVESGRGGNASTTGAGGAGGTLNLINVNVDGNVAVSALDGGNGAGTGGGGVGGSLIAVGAFARDGSGELQAGDAGAGAKAARGGSIAGTTAQLVGLRAAGALTIIAGNGAAGGDGGSISGVAFGSSFGDLRPTPSGNIEVRAGDGSAGPRTVGKGGSIFNVSGSASSGAGTTTTLKAGAGAGIAARGADGGSVMEVLLTGGGDDDILGNTVQIVVQAGDAGDAAAAARGAKGGQIKNLAFSGLDPDATVRSIIAGDGGNASPATGTGGIGGTIDGVRVLGGTDPTTGRKLNADIGYRSGKTFGEASMGGLFAGVAGAGAAGKATVPGSVRNISADSIAAIVAGRDAAPQAADVVENVFLNALQPLVTGVNSPFTFTFGAATTAPLTLLDPLSVQNAINALGGPQVTVTRTSLATFVLTANGNGDINQFTAEENVAREVIELESGNQGLIVKEAIPGTLVSPETQTFKPKTNGTYAMSYAGDAPVTLNFNDPAATVEQQLNLLPSVIGAGGVKVTGDPTNGFAIKFVLNGERVLFAANANVQEVQRIDTLGVGLFQIATGFGTTARLAANATALDVQTAINNLGGPTVAVAPDPADATAYIVTFAAAGERAEFQVTEYAPLTAATTTPGDANTREVQTLSFTPRATFLPGNLTNANSVGAILDPNEIGAATFKFTPVGAPHATFQLGDVPIDGLIIARTLNQATINFAPEASLIGSVFFDNDNKI